MVQDTHQQLGPQMLSDSPDTGWRPNTGLMWQGPTQQIFLVLWNIKSSIFAHYIYAFLILIHAYTTNFLIKYKIVKPLILLLSAEMSIYVSKFSSFGLVPTMSDTTLVWNSDHMFL